MALTDYSIDTSDQTAQGGPIAGPNSIRRRHQWIGAAIFLLVRASLNGGQH